MDIRQMEKKTSHTKSTQTKSPQSSSLAMQAMKEECQTGRVTVTCPKCHSTLKISTTQRGERTIVSCDCNYIYYCEINF